jgi:hypothetical protein
MWSKSKNESELLKKAIEFTGDAELYGKWMVEVSYKWKYSCEHHLTDMSINRKAYIGHCAVCLALGIPEYITRLAWHNLSEQQQIDANRKAEIAIKMWEKRQEGIECQKDIQMKMF